MYIFGASHCPFGTGRLISHACSWHVADRGHFARVARQYGGRMRISEARQTPRHGHTRPGIRALGLIISRNRVSHLARNHEINSSRRQPAAAHINHADVAYNRHVLCVFERARGREVIAAARRYQPALHMSYKG